MRPGAMRSLAAAEGQAALGSMLGVLPGVVVNHGDATGEHMAIRITVTVDEARLAQSGAPEQTDEGILGLLERMKDDGRLSLQSVSHWLPVRDMRVRMG